MYVDLATFPCVEDKPELVGSLGDCRGLGNHGREVLALVLVMRWLLPRIIALG